MDRPLLSVIIPCYNDGRYKKGEYLDRLLNNIYEQNIDKDKLEVVVVDDCSPHPFKRILNSYRNKLNIVYTKTEYSCCPGNSRQHGTEIAKGEWICFADHDDLFYPNAFELFQAVLTTSSPQYVIVSKFNKVESNDLNNVIEKFDTNWNFVHGKFYNLDNFWKRFKLHFPKDLKTHEDIAVGNQTKCAILSLGDQVQTPYITLPTYMWIHYADSTSHANYVEQVDCSGAVHTFLETHFKDYLDSGINSIMDCQEATQMSRDNLINLLLPEFCNCWTLLASWKTSNPTSYITENELYVSKAWKQFREQAEISMPVVKVVLSKNFQDIKLRIDQTAVQYDTDDLFTWLDKLDSMDTSSLNVSATNSIKRPYFSIVIPCYNDGRYKKGQYLDRLLNSLCDQGLEKDEYEIIISDDHSPVPYDQLVDSYRDRLTIKRITTDYNFAPGNTRAKGMELVTGEWVAFADHDDYYYPKALRATHKGIIEKKEKYYVFTDFNGVNPDGSVKKVYKATMNWCHGKFFNMDNLWNPFGIHFIHDLRSHEDIAICTQVACALSAMGRNELCYLPFSSYAWTDNPESVSHSKYTVNGVNDERYFLEVFFPDYLAATGEIYLSHFNTHTIKFMYAVQMCLEILCYCYFYTESFMFNRPDDYIKENLGHTGNYLRKIEETFNLDVQRIYDAVGENHAAMFYKIRPLAEPGSGRFLPQHGFKEWLDLIEHQEL